MTIEQKVFEKRKLDREKLVAYGFRQSGGRLVLHKKLSQDNFEAEIFVDENDVIGGRIIDLDFGDEYLGLRLDETAGAYAGGIREEYSAILEDIAEHCAHKLYFHTPQANRIGAWLIDTYGCTLRFPWPKLPGHGLFEAGGEALASIINVDRLTNNRQSTTAEELNIRAEGEKRDIFLQKNGVLPSYYKGAKHWVALRLDGRFSDEEIKKLFAESYIAAHTQSAWILPANNERYDIIGHFAVQDNVVWKQASGARIGDTAYIYMAAPYSSILYRCRVVQTDIFRPYGDDAKISKGMKLKLEKSYNPGQIPFPMLKEYGVSLYRGTKKLPDSLKKILDEE